MSSEEVMRTARERMIGLLARVKFFVNGRTRL